MIFFYPLVVWMAVTFLTAGRKFFLGGVESDYLGTYLVEAARFLTGQPLLIQFHLPFYSILIGLFNQVVHNWLITGLVISWVSTAAAVFLIFLFFYHLVDRWAAWGALWALASSETFFVHAASASSDIFFLMLYSAAIGLAFKRHWVWAGLFAGFSFLTRTNALCLLPLLAAPFLSKEDSPKKFLYFSLFFLSFLAPILVWLVYALQTHSPFFPQETHVNLAMTYFASGTERVTHDGYFLMKEKFSNLGDVLAYDPVRMALIYSRDFVVMAVRNLSVLVPFWLGLAALLGFPLLAQKSKKPFVFIYLLITLLHILLVNAKAYEDRFYLFLIPLLGASAGFILEKILVKTKRPGLIFLLIFMGSAIFYSWRAYRSLHPPFEEELKEVMINARGFVPRGSLIIARKPHVPFYLESEQVFFPNVDTLEKLKNELVQLPKGREIFLYYGSYEKEMRGALSSLSKGREMEFLIPVARSEVPGNWVLFSFPLDRGDKGTGPVNRRDSQNLAGSV